MLLLRLVIITIGLSVGNQLLAAERPNMLLIIADDASRDSFGAYGSIDINTPGLDRIAREGVLFTQAYNCNPKCAPARACLLTGRYSWQLEEACNHSPFLSEKWAFYPYLLEEHGYQIGFTGKGWGPGKWQDYDKPPQHGTDNPAGHPYNQLRLQPPYQGISNIDYAANFAAFLQSVPKNSPFCFWFGVKEPHRFYQRDSWKLAGRKLADVTVPAYYPDHEVIRGDLADYAIEVEWFDQQIQQALSHLEQRGELDNTIIIATSDHGMPFPRVKGQIYDDAFRVPFVVRWGKKIKAGRRVTDFITFPDVAPTLLEVVGIAPHPQMTGQSFLPQLLSEQSGRIDQKRDHTLLGKERHDIGRTDGPLLSVGYPVRAIRNDRFLYVRNFAPHRWPAGGPKLGLRNCDGSPTKQLLVSLVDHPTDSAWYAKSFGKRPLEELYDVQADPDCVVNLVQEKKFADTKTQLWRQLKSELTAQGDPRMLGRGEIFDYYPYSGIEKQRQAYGDPTFDPIKQFQEKFGRPRDE